MLAQEGGPGGAGGKKTTPDGAALQPPPAADSPPPRKPIELATFEGSADLNAGGSWSSATEPGNRLFAAGHETQAPGSTNATRSGFDFGGSRVSSLTGQLTVPVGHGVSLFVKGQEVFSPYGVPADSGGAVKSENGLPARSVNGGPQRSAFADGPFNDHFPNGQFYGGASLLDGKVKAYYGAVPTLGSEAVTALTASPGDLIANYYAYTSSRYTDFTAEDGSLLRGAARVDVNNIGATWDGGKQKLAGDLGFSVIVAPGGEGLGHFGTVRSFGAHYNVDAPNEAGQKTFHGFPLGKFQSYAVYTEGSGYVAISPSTTPSDGTPGTVANGWNILGGVAETYDFGKNNAVTLSLYGNKGSAGPSTTPVAVGQTAIDTRLTSVTQSGAKDFLTKGVGVTWTHKSPTSAQDMVGVGYTGTNQWGRNGNTALDGSDSLISASYSHKFGNTFLGGKAQDFTFSLSGGYGRTSGAVTGPPNAGHDQWRVGFNIRYQHGTGKVKISL